MGLQLLRAAHHDCRVALACLIGNNAEARKTAVSLLGDDEKMEDVKYVVNVVVDLDPDWVAQCEREAIGDAVLK